MAITLDGTNGVTTPDVEVSSGGSASAPAITVTGDTNTGIFFPAADTIAFAEGGAEAMRINSSGNVGIGTSSPESYYSKELVISTADNGGITLATGTTQASYIMFADGTSGADAYRGQIGYDHATNHMQFNVNAAEAMRIDSSGNLLVGTTSSEGKLTVVSSSLTTTALSVDSSGASNFQRCVITKMSGRSPNDASSYFLSGNDSTTTRYVMYSNGGLHNYSANNSNLSDRREKTNFAPAKNYLDTICAIPVQTFNYIDQNNEDDPGLTLGVVAQDVQEVAPELVMESNWGTEEEPKMRLSIYQTDLQYALMKSIQELKAINDAQASRIETLEAKVAALEANNV